MNINAIMQSLNLSSLGWVAVVIAVIGAVWKISTWTTTVDNRLSGVEKIMEGITKKVDEVYRVIVMSHGRAIEKIDSPVTLSGYGQELFAQIDAEKIVDAYADKLYGDTQGMNAYKVQERCFLFCKEKLLDDLEAKDKDQFDKISQVAFDEGIDIEKSLALSVSRCGIECSRWKESRMRKWMNIPRMTTHNERLFQR